MDWELDDSRSIYPQLKELIKRGILVGEYAPGSAFPTVRELAQDAGVNRNTMQRAMAELESEGLLITNRTAGRTVTTDLTLIEKMRRELAEKQVDTFLQEMASLGYSPQGTLAEVAARIQGAGDVNAGLHGIANAKDAEDAGLCDDAGKNRPGEKRSDEKGSDESKADEGDADAGNAAPQGTKAAADKSGGRAGKAGKTEIEGGLKV